MGDKDATHSSSGWDGSLATLANRQYGVVSVRQLMGLLGYSRNDVTRATRVGRLHRIHRGVYAVGHTRISLEGKCLAGVLACGSRALLSHGSAAWLWGISRRSPIPVEVTVLSHQAPKPPIVLHFSRALTDEDRALEEEIPVTSLPRTLLDQAAAVRFEYLRRMLERAEELRIFDLRAVEALLVRSKGHPGVGRMRRALVLYRTPPFTRSGLERRFLELVEKAGLPRPVTGFNEIGYELDVYWPEERFGVELGTFETHGSREAFEEDKRRREDLKLAGVEMVDVTGHRLNAEPRQVVERVARLLAQRRGEHL